MTTRRIWRRSLAATLAAALAASMAQAQPPTTPASSTATTPLPQEAEDRVTVTAMVPVPVVGPGAPYYAPSDIDRMRAATRMDSNRTRRDREGCTDVDLGAGLNLRELLNDELDYAEDVILAGGRALEVTLAAEASRRAPPGGNVDDQEVIRMELERQKAIIDFDKKRLDLINARAAVADYQELARGGAEVSRAQLMVRQTKRMNAGWGVNTLASTTTPDFALENTTAAKTKGPKGDARVMVKGIIRNKTDKALTIPKLTLTILDERGWFLSAVPAEARGQIKAGQAIAFQYELKDIPKEGENLVVGFASEIDPPPRMPMSSLEECNAELRGAKDRAFSLDD